MRRLVRTWWRRLRPDRTLRSPGQAREATEHQVAKRRLLEEAERLRGDGGQGRHRWHDGPTVRLPLHLRHSPLLTYGQRCGYRTSRG